MSRYHARRALRPAVLVGFSRSRIDRCEVIDGVRVVLVPFQRAPDMVIGRDVEITSEKRAELQSRYVFSIGGLPLTCIRDDQTFFQLVDPVVTTQAAA